MSLKREIIKESQMRVLKLKSPIARIKYSIRNPSYKFGLSEERSQLRIRSSKVEYRLVIAEW